MSTEQKKIDLDIQSRVSTAKWILDLSYRLISHYDNKTNQLVTLIGFDFTVISAIIAILFNNSEHASVTLRITTLSMSIVVYVLICISLWKVRGALIPHVNHIGKGHKKKPGLVYFMDIKTNFGEDEYVQKLLNPQNVSTSDFYAISDNDAFEKCIIEDCARDIFAHAEILEVKTKFVKEAFDFTFITTIVSIIAVSIFAIMKASGL